MLARAGTTAEISLKKRALVVITSTRIADRIFEQKTESRYEAQPRLGRTHTKCSGDRGRFQATRESCLTCIDIRESDDGTERRIWTN